MPSDPFRRRILIGEADPVHRNRLQHLLGDLGYGWEFSAEGDTALKILKQDDAPLIALLDFDLPGLSCTEICQALGPQKPETSPWIIAMGATKSVDFLETRTKEQAPAVQTGICDVLSKPIDRLELQLRLQTAERVQILKEELKRSIETAGFQASHDPLTGLWNREALLPLLFQETDRVRRGAAPMALILMDLDHFMHRNLEFGYDACDSVLRQLAVRLRRQLRSYDILGRSGEDGFLVALPGCGLDDAMAMAERLRVRVMHSAFRARTFSFTVSASFGVAESRGRSPLIVLREAERALAAAKEAGRDRIRYFQTDLHPNARVTPRFEGAINLSETSPTNRLAFFPSALPGNRDDQR